VRHSLAKNYRLRPRADNLSSLSALITALADLDALCATIEERYLNDVQEGDYERWVERS
jgi:DNA-directed RNA polymerase I and III subunit RPAC2